MALREHEAIGAWMFRVFGIESHLREEERRDEIRRRAAADRMSAGSFGGRSDRIDSQARCDVLESGKESGAVHQRRLQALGQRTDSISDRRWERVLANS